VGRGVLFSVIHARALRSSYISCGCRVGASQEADDEGMRVLLLGLTMMTRAGGAGAVEYWLRILGWQLPGEAASILPWSCRVVAEVVFVFVVHVSCIVLACYRGLSPVLC